MLDLFDQQDPPEIEGTSLDQYIQMLVDLREKVGGAVKVHRWSGPLGRHVAKDPKLAYVKVGRQGLTESFWNENYDPLEARGPLVVRV